MPKFVKKPIVVEAVQFTGDNWDEVSRFVGFHKDSSGDHDIQTFNPIGTYLGIESDEKGFISHTGELWVAANKQWLPIQTGEWIIKDSLGFYPCQEEKFAETYDPVVICENHKPVQHRDGKPAWCKVCGLTANFKEPKSHFSN